jgi:hypothetical protein
MFHLAVYVLASGSTRDIVNEELYNGMEILKVAWINDIYAVYFVQYVEVLCMVVTICVSRLQDLHDAQPISCSSSHEDALCSANNSTNRHEDDNGEVENNIHLISMALEQGLFLICSLVTPSHGGKETYACAFYKERLRNLDIPNQIVRMGNLSTQVTNSSNHLIWIMD